MKTPNQQYLRTNQQYLRTNQQYLRTNQQYLRKFLGEALCFAQLGQAL